MWWSGSAQGQILSAACCRLAMVRIYNSGPGWKQGLTPFVGQQFRKNNSSSSLSKDDTKQFRELSQKIRDTKTNNKTMLTSLSDMMDNYKNLLQPNGIFSQRSSPNNNEIVNIKVNYENLWTAHSWSMRLKLQLKSLKTNTFSVLDSIISEMIKCANDKILAQITKLFNGILDSGIPPKRWSHGLFVQKFKMTIK